MLLYGTALCVGNSCELRGFCGVDEVEGKTVCATILAARKRHRRHARANRRLPEIH